MNFMANFLKFGNKMKCLGTVIHLYTCPGYLSDQGNRDMCTDVRRLPILEALYIKDLNPKLKVQANDLQVLPSMRRKRV